MQVSVGLTFPGKLKDESIICFVCKSFEVNINIIEASFSSASGWAILGIEGEKEEIDKVFDYLRGKEININRVGQAA
ncbi:MAG: NIL domain-containing protein [Candidatus Omnitrophota bacterium]